MRHWDVGTLGIAWVRVYAYLKYSCGDFQYNNCFFFSGFDFDSGWCDLNLDLDPDCDLNPNLGSCLDSQS